MPPFRPRAGIAHRLQNALYRTTPAMLVCTCALLILCSQTALESAQAALSLWWNRVLPALFPFYVLTTLLDRYGALAWLCMKLRTPLIPCFLFGMLGGYPTGARIARLLSHEDAAKYCNLCSPMFLMGVVATGMCGDARTFFPLALAHYGSAALALVFGNKKRLADIAPPAPRSGPAGSVLGDIASGMQVMLTVGGCIVFFYVPVNTLLDVLLRGRFPVLAAIVTGMTELTSGCQTASTLALPTPVIAGLLAFFITFGGVCVFAQAMLVGELRRPAAYLVSKAAQGCLAAMLAYVLTPIFVHKSVQTLRSTAESYAQNALVGFTFLAAACVGLIACYLLALVLRQRGAKVAEPRIAAYRMP